MSFRGRVFVSAFGMFAMMLIAGLPIVAQDPGGSKQVSPPAKKKEAARRVPDYFGQIGLTPEQKTTIYAIQAKHMEKIQALEIEIANHRAQILDESEKVLTDVQKKLLADLRKAATEPAAKPAK